MINENDILSTSSGKKAIEIFKEHKDDICLILLDLFLVGGVDGFSVMKAALKIKPDISIFVESAQTYLIERVIDMGCVGYVTKPFMLRDFAEKIKIYIK